jgi:hypothetical protein
LVEIDDGSGGGCIVGDLVRAPGGSGGGFVGFAPRVAGGIGGLVGFVARAGLIGSGVSFASTIAVSSWRRASEPGGGGGSVFCFLRTNGASGVGGVPATAVGPVRADGGVVGEAVRPDGVPADGVVGETVRPDGVPADGVVGETVRPDGGVVGETVRPDGGGFVGEAVRPDGGVIAGTGIRVAGVTGRIAASGLVVLRPRGGASATAESSGSTDHPDASSAIRSSVSSPRGGGVFPAFDADGAGVLVGPDGAAGFAASGGASESTAQPDERSAMRAFVSSPRRRRVRSSSGTAKR